MKKPFTSICKLLLLALAWGSSATAWGQTYTPVALTGFTEDIIANGPGAVSASTTSDIDGAAATGGTGYCLMAQDYVGPTGQVPNPSGYPAATYPALETSGLITSALNSAITYQLASYSASNALRLYGAGATGTLSFTTPSRANELYVIGTSGNAASVLTITVNFADGTTQVFTNQTIADWFAGSQPNVARERLGRVSRADNAVQYTTGSGSAIAGPRLYQLRLVLDAANITKNITGITFLKPAANGNTVLLAVTANNTPVCAAAPTGLSTVATTTSGGATALTTACSSTNIYLSVSGLGNQTGYTYQWQSSANGTTWTNITGATGTTYTATGQTAATSYRLLVTCPYAGTGSAGVPSTPVQIAQSSFANCYCTVISTGTNEYIKSVTLPGAPGFTNATGANSATGYGDFTANSAYTTTLNRGATANLSVTVRANNTGSQGGLWVDYDHNGVFDASEYTLVGNSSLTGADVVFPVSLAVPATALAGATRMRVRWRNSAFTSADACVSGATTWYGETEDYLVTLSATPLATTAGTSAARLALFPNPTQSVATLGGAEAGATVQVLDVLGRAVLSVKADATGKATLALPTSLAKGVYVVRTGQQTTRLVLE
jgi:hypothetical protein